MSAECEVPRSSSERYEFHIQTTDVELEPSIGGLNVELSLHPHLRNHVRTCDLMSMRSRATVLPPTRFKRAEPVPSPPRRHAGSILNSFRRQ